MASPTLSSLDLSLPQTLRSVRHICLRRRSPLRSSSRSAAPVADVIVLQTSDRLADARSDASSPESFTDAARVAVESLNL